MIEMFDMREKLAKFDRTPEDKTLRLGYCPIFDIENQSMLTAEEKEEIIENVRNHPQIIRMELDGVERPFMPYYDPY
jgi:hypothetical protein